MRKRLTKLSYERDGVEIVADALAGQLDRLRQEADRVATAAGTACVRQVCASSELFREIAESKVMRGLLPRRMALVRSILFDKTADANWPVAWHRDLTIAVVEKIEVEGYGPWSVKAGVPHVHAPISLLAQMRTLRLHLDDAPETNGALRVVPGSHVIAGTNTADFDVAESEAYALTCACRAGDVLKMSPLILHASSRATIPSRRRILHLEYAPIQALNASLRWHF